MHKKQTSQDIIKFLQKYTITYIDPQTSIIEYNSQKSSNNNLNANQYSNQLQELGFTNVCNSSGVRNKMQQAVTQKDKKIECYLLKDMVVKMQDECQGNDGNKNSNHVSRAKDKLQSNNSNVLNTVLQTLTAHQQLNNKYLLTLIHHEVSTKIVDYCESQIIQNSQSRCHKQNPKQTQIQQYLQQSFHQQFSSHLQSQQSSSHHQSYSQSSHKPNTGTLLKHNNQNSFSNSHMNSNIVYNTSYTNANKTQNNVKNNTSSCNVETPKTCTQIQIKAIYQYGKLSLKQEIHNRVASSTRFQEQELWAILATIVQALSYLQDKDIVYGVLSTDKIFINDSLVRVLDPSATATDPFLITQGRLYSPQILNQQQNIDLFKSDVYVAGLIVLQCGLLVDLSAQIQPNLTKYITQFQTLYSSQLTTIIQQCLNISPDSRPSFTQLKQILSKQLDMNDFSSAYDDKDKLLLQPLEIDKEDTENEPALQIEAEQPNQQINYDVLYQSIGQDQQQIVPTVRRIVTQHQRAKQRYLGISAEHRQHYSTRHSMTRDDRNNINGSHLHKTHSHHHRHASNSPIQTRRNSRTDNVMQGSSKQLKYFPKNNQRLPNLNMAISQSVFTDQIIPGSTVSNKQMQKTNRKSQRNLHPNPNAQYYAYESKSIHNRLQKQNMDTRQNYQQIQQYSENHQKLVLNPSHKLKKTKLIKDKLVKNQQQSYQYQNSYSGDYTNQIYSNNSDHRNSMKLDRNHGQLQTFGATKPKSVNTNNANSNHNIYNYLHPDAYNSNNYIYQQQQSTNTKNTQKLNNAINNNKYNKCQGQSIQQQLQQQSDSSYLYYNTNGSSKISKNHLSAGNTDSNCTDNSNSASAKSKGSNRYNNNCQNQPQCQQFQPQTHVMSVRQSQRQPLMSVKNRNMKMVSNNDDHLFTDPNLMQTIKDDLARISTSKNLKLAGSGHKQKKQMFQNSMKQSKLQI